MSASFADEVVTRALVRYLDVPGLAGQFALITLDNGRDHTRPSTFGPAGLASLDDAITEIEAHEPAVAAIGVTGKPFVFAVGADLGGVALVGDRDQALVIARLGHRIFRRLKDSSVPTFAFVNGAVMGGGLELALHCDYRTLARSVSAIALPEVSLGLIPGWGGTQLLPRLVGPDAAVTVIVENPLNQNAMLRAKQAAALGIVDVVLDDADFLAQSLAWSVAVVNGTIPISRADHRDDDWTAALARGTAIAEAKLHGSAPAATRALELIALAQTASFTDGTAAEDEALAAAIMSDELRASLYAFELIRTRGRRPTGAPDRALARRVTKVGVVGAGLMASQLALLFARQLEVPVVMTDLDEQRLAAGVARVHHEIDTLAERHRISPAKANRLRAAVTGSLDYAAFADADLVIEAVFEELPIKQSVFAALEQHVAATAILATNTSALSVSAMAAGLSHPERVVGLHFFNPVALLPLVEVIRADATDDASLATAVAVAGGLRKNAVLVRDAPGFVVNRLLTRLLGEVVAAVDEGTPIEVADTALYPLGLPMTPFALLGLVGPAVSLHVAETLHAAYPDRFGVSENLRRLVAAGKPGVYQWTDGRPSIDRDALALFEVGDRPSTAEQVRDRACAALADEIERMLTDGVVAGPSDIDLCLLLGSGWPLHDGGITPYLDRRGVSERVNGHRFLAPGVASGPSAVTSPERPS
jgi:3-hydroxyacyl-CoA dehydrogenase/enoyl-CoA hydratase/carnithine racemase